MNDDKNLQNDEEVSEDTSVAMPNQTDATENIQAPETAEDIASVETEDVEEKIKPETSEPKEIAEKLTAEQIKEDTQMAPVEDPDEELEKAKKVLNSTDPNDPARWYIVHTYSGHENKVAKSIKQRVQSLGFENRIFDIIVPTRNTIKVSQGKKETVKEKIFPGYVLVKMALDDESWLLIRTTQGVTAFIGAGNKPTPISEKEVEAIQKFMNEDEPLYKTSFTLGEAVKIVDGPFADFLGTIDDIDEAKGKLKVLVSIFGRETPVELDFLQVNKL
jgi:transcription termination/antitermination protein NusG